MPAKRIVILTGAGISAESGIATFRASDGLWENHRVEDVATPEGFARNPKLVHDFYNARRARLHDADVQPNAAHMAIAKLQRALPGQVTLVTQNVDDLHERAGSRSVLHLHGELNKLRSSADEDEIIGWQGDQRLEDCDSKGRPLRPHIVWFGEEVPLIGQAAQWVEAADTVIVVGTSLKVYPAAGLLAYARADADIYLIDPKPNLSSRRVEIIPQTACAGVPPLVEWLLAKAA